MPQKWRERKRERERANEKAADQERKGLFKPYKRFCLSCDTYYDKLGISKASHAPSSERSLDKAGSCLLRIQLRD